MTDVGNLPLCGGVAVVQSQPKSHTVQLTVILAVYFAPQSRWHQKPWKGLLRIIVFWRWLVNYTMCDCQICAGIFPGTGQWFKRTIFHLIISPSTPSVFSSTSISTQSEHDTLCYKIYFLWLQSCDCNYIVTSLSRHQINFDDNFNQVSVNSRIVLILTFNLLLSSYITEAPVCITSTSSSPNQLLPGGFTCMYRTESYICKFLPITTP